MEKETLEEAAERITYHEELSWENTLSKKCFIEGAEWQQKQMYSEEELRNAMNWMMTQYFEFHECPTTGRIDHYVQSIKQQEQ